MRVLPLFWNLAFIVKELLRVPIDVIAGIERRIYVLSSEVNAPKEICWAVVSAHKITLESTPPMELDTEPDPLRPGVFSGVCRFGDRLLPFAYQILDERPGEAIKLRLLMDECDPVYRLGEDYVGAVAVVGDGQQSTITNSCELTHTKFTTRLIMPLTVLRGAQSLKRTAEVRAGTGERTVADQVKNAVITGALTFASFFALFGGSVAASLLLIILLHELGHVIAMRWAGIPVRGIYFVPFFGGVAVGESLGTSEITRGAVALMGPGFSILTTSIFALLSFQNDDPFLADLALVSAMLNGFNLLPILPLDGGRVLQALTSPIAPGVARIVQAFMLCAGIGLAAVFGDYLLMALFLIIAPAVFSMTSGTTIKLTPLSRSELAWLAAGYIATFTYYVAVALKLWNETPVLND
jgi:Zn-dependent protease